MAVMESEYKKMKQLCDMQKEDLIASRDTITLLKENLKVAERNWLVIGAIYT